MLHALFMAAAVAAAAPAEKMVEAPGPAGPLHGILREAAVPDAPVALIIPGSGPTDLNGDNPGQLKAASYRLLAEGLSAEGVSVARIDKRGMFSSASPGVDPNAVTLQDYAADIHAWTARLSANLHRPCVWLIGHSEGGLVAMAAAADHDAHICGLVLIAAPGRNLADVLTQQLHANPANAPLLPAADHAIAELRAGRRIASATLPAPLQPLFNDKVQGFLISLFAAEPPALIKAFSGPVMLMRGSTDLQVAAADQAALAAARPDAEVVTIEGMNHVLKDAPAAPMANLATYANPNLPLDGHVVPAVAGFIKQPR